MYFITNLSIDKKQSKIMQKFIISVTKENFNLIEDKRFECFILSESLGAEFKSAFAQKAKEQNKLVLSFSKEDCLKYNLDGLIVDLSKSEHILSDYEKATGDLKDKFIGVICRNRRHEAMLCSECEPDFIVFRAWEKGADKVKELISWYADLFLIQSAVLPMEIVDFTAFETDFVILDDVLLKGI